jgi:CO/xanthine dehydrogenase Mo-binding subunit
MQRVLRAAADAFGKPFAKAPSGRGYGIVCTDYQNTYVAAAAEVKVDSSSGKIQVERIVCAQDLGEVINPEGATLQVEGGLTMGLGYVLSEEIRFHGGRILDENFGTYKIAKFSWVPKLETILLESDDVPAQGCGEPSITTMGGVIANAVFDAIGIRLYELPMTPARILRAIERAAG